MLADKIMPNEYGQAILFYTDKADKGTTILEVLENSKQAMKQYLQSIPDDKIDYQYANGKWTVAEVIQHIISYELIMTERALVVAGIKTDSLKFTFYTQSTTVAGAKNKSKQELLEEFTNVRENTIEAFKSLTDGELKTVGTLDGNIASVRMIGLCISGHQTHHFNVLKNRYGLL
ncbi:hypothetical protein HME9304_01230 [Flagellimonas maritima]|uniref:DinB-like domain-containing protein n=2 Tax=Flagellimonas maritima TaxID=1383885 RepID=A0A2Z4LRA7_9FLAO|nr:hypothetical protein HME9304_01230 [Allomuricauda aurantiaca]